MAKRSTKSSVKHRPTIRQRTVKYKAKADPSAIQNSSASCCPPVAHNHDMRSVASDRAGNKISRQVIRWLLAQAHGIPAAFEIGF